MVLLFVYVLGGAIQPGTNSYVPAFPISLLIARVLLLGARVFPGFRQAIKEKRKKRDSIRTSTHNRHGTDL